ncbi:MAG: hypothetical protein QOI64_1968, partial [Solirubrobacteraceae bacterium]|nr:hypothetical protein [Solirubrobacteraceae bacterium]
MHVVVLASTERGIDAVLDDAVGAVRQSHGRISIGAVREPARIACGIGYAGAPIVSASEGERAAVSELAQRLVARLPPDVDATHAGFLGWGRPELRRFLRSCAADRVMM